MYTFHYDIKSGIFEGKWWLRLFYNASNYTVALSAVAWADTPNRLNHTSFIGPWGIWLVSD